ncbi:DUF445 family protein [Desulfitobacterium sp. AusDCA]|uniref:DUF445 family protein n=1 Tax=Desulfitobacterium sp. AusDCA TaxID=3240383 RepID=UPI003DA76CA4
MRKRVASISTYRKANWALGVTALGLGAAYPFQSQFWGGLLTSGCSAGLVGGLADWFAVTALFRKPLGIHPGRIFRTEIIPRNRERIFNELAHMVQDELLSQEALTQRIARVDFANGFIKMQNGKMIEQLRPTLETLIQPLLGSISLPAGEFFKMKKEREIEQAKIELWSSLLRQAYRFLKENGSVQNMLKILSGELSQWIQSPEMHGGIKQWIEDALADYVQENPSRKIVQMFLPDSSELAKKIQIKAVNYLSEGQAAADASAWLDGFVQDSRFDEFTLHILSVLFKEGEKIILPPIQAGLNNQESVQQIVDFLLRQLEQYRGELLKDAEKRETFNHKVKSFLSGFVTVQHDKIGRFVLEGLEQYSDEMLVDLIEAKTGEDLQMIRINGSVVGALAGMLFYLVNYLF